MMMMALAASYGCMTNVYNEMITDNVGEYNVTPFRARKILGGCVKVAEEPREVFSKLMLLFSLTDSWVGGDEDTSFSQIMCVL